MLHNLNSDQIRLIILNGALVAGQKLLHKRTEEEEFKLLILKDDILKKELEKELWIYIKRQLYLHHKNDDRRELEKIEKKLI